MNKINTLKVDKSVCFLIVLYIGLLLQFSLMYGWTFWTYSKGTIVTYLFNVIGDAAIVVLPCVFLPRRYRWIELVVAGMITVTMYLNLWYYPFFGDYMSPSVIANPQLLDNTVLKCAISAIEMKHILIGLIFWGYVLLYVYWRREIESVRYSWRARVVLGIIIMSLLAMSLAKAIRNRYVYHGAVMSVGATIKEYIADYRDCVFPAFIGFVRGYTYVGSYVRTFISPVDEIELTYDLENEINRKFPVLAIRNDSIKNGDKIENLIFIVVESLNSSAIYKSFIDKNGDCVDVMPNMKAFAEDSIHYPKTVAWINMRTQVGTGGSSDGQFMYNTGLIPPRQFPVVTHFGDAPYPSIAKSLPDSFLKWEVIGEKDNSWNHRTTTKSYGYDELISGIVSVGENNIYKMREDSIIFEQALRSLIEKNNAHSYMFVTSLGMHTPYLSVTAPEVVKNNPAMNPSEAVYLALCHEFDKVLGRFIENLKKIGKYENALIVIASDHTAPAEFLPAHYKNDNALFMVMNNPVEKKIGLQRDTIGQIDVYPTVLDCMGLYDNVRWKGFGRSLIREVSEPIPQITVADVFNGINETDRILSEKIICSRYFMAYPE